MTPAELRRYDPVDWCRTHHKFECAEEHDVEPTPQTVRHIVKQSLVIHPTWSLTDHLHYLEHDEFIDITPQVFYLVKDTFEKGKRDAR